MHKLVFVVPAAAMAMLGAGAFGLKAATLNSPPIVSAGATQSLVQKAACGGPGRYCGWGRHRVCRRWHCWCAPC
jgi:hypothetical protein